jgi:hypothetical protein
MESDSILECRFNFEMRFGRTFLLVTGVIALAGRDMSAQELHWLHLKTR